MVGTRLRGSIVKVPPQNNKKLSHLEKLIQLSVVSNITQSTFYMVLSFGPKSIYLSLKTMKVIRQFVEPKFQENPVIDIPSLFH